MNYKISKIKDKEEIVDLLIEIFSSYYQESREWYKEQIKDVDYNISMAIYDNNTLIAFYLLQPNNIPFEYIKGKGLEGVALGIKKEYRGQKLSELFFNEVYLMDFDYWWGTADIVLNNLNFWLKYRTFLMEYKNHYYTYKNLK